MKLHCAMRIVMVTLLPAWFTACNDAKTEAGATPPKVSGATIAFPESSAQLEAIVSEPVRAAESINHTLNGRLVWDEDRTVRVFTPLAGRVELVRVTPGDRVAAGQVLATIASPDYGQTQAEASRAAADFVVASKNLERTRDLAANGVVAEKDLHSAEADFERAKGELARVTARNKLYGGSSAVDQRFELKTPVAGAVVEKNINPGQEVRPDQLTSNAAPLFVITDPKRLWVQLDANERDLTFLRVGMPVVLRTPAYPEHTFPGRVEAISDSIDPSTRMIKVRASVANPERALKAEMFVTGEFDVARAEGVLVPAPAVFLVGDRHYVFVEEAKGRFTRTEVGRDGEVGGNVSVISGLRPGQRVVTVGPLLLQQVLQTQAGS